MTLPDLDYGKPDAIERVATHLATRSSRQPAAKFFRTEQEGKMWSAYCDILEQGASGYSEDEALYNLVTSLSAFFHALEFRGLLAERLREFGAL